MTARARYMVVGVYKIPVAKDGRSLPQTDAGGEKQVGSLRTSWA